MHTDWAGMAQYGLASWIANAVAVGAVLYPVGRILRRMGLSPFLSIVAFIDWPKRTSSTE